MLDSAAPVRLRADIQALRGLAILLVMLHHAQIGGLRAGFLGVDIFFVISGFLISGLILDSLRRGDFSFTDFYFRRAKRLLPAAYVTFVLVTLASPWFILASESENYFRQLLGAVSFTGNIALWLQSGYFEQSAYLKPLLHTWSLAIEEQFYLLLPALLLFTASRFRIAMLAAICLLSLMLCFLLAPRMPSATFYLLPTRAWELLVGSLSAVLVTNQATHAVAKWMFWPSLLIVLALPTVAAWGTHPGVSAVLVTTATAMLLLRRHPVLNDGMPIRQLGQLGNISYSLYLLHWPLLAFANNAYVSGVPTTVRASLLLLAVALAALLYRYVELPVWRSNWRGDRRSYGIILASTLLVITVGATSAIASRSGVDHGQLRAPNRGLNESCDATDRFVPSAACVNGQNPRVLVWGDSFAMHLVPGIVATADFSIAQATKSACAPFLGLAQQVKGKFERDWGRNCMTFNQTAVQYLESTPTIEVVVIAAHFPTYLDSKAPDREALLVQSAGEELEQPRGVESTLVATVESIRAARRLGKRVLVVAPPPNGGFDVGECLERELTGRLHVTSQASGGCAILRDTYRIQSAESAKFLRLVSSKADVEILDFDSVLCDRDHCAAQIDGVGVYGQNGHFSRAGSIAVGKRMNLSKLVLDMAK
ncbi:MAG: acyltransferase [Xanthomonadales bacterium]|nr:acyltransferase [Xanthomonadales bacterium]